MIGTCLDSFVFDMWRHMYSMTHIYVRYDSYYNINFMNDAIQVS